jgi:acid phosphatase type 7
LFYSWNYSWVHFISLSTEHSFEKDSDQVKWLINDLKNVNSTETPFIIVYQHRPMYSSNKNHGSFLKYRENVEPLLKNVDLLLFGHVHAYGFFFFFNFLSERTCPIFKEECVGTFTKNYFYNPKSPIHLCVGTAGYTANRDWEVQPKWSLFRDSSHGFASVTVSSRNALYVEFFQNDVTKAKDSFFIFKD